MAKEGLSGDVNAAGKNVHESEADKTIQTPGEEILGGAPGKIRQRGIFLPPLARRGLSTLFRTQLMDTNSPASSLFGRGPKKNKPAESPSPVAPEEQEPTAAPAEEAQAPAEERNESPAPDSTEEPVASNTSSPSMPQKPSLTFSFDARGAKRPPRAPSAPFVIALFGDFSGRANRGIVESVGERKPVAVDLDSFEDVFSKFAPSLTLPEPGAPDRTVELSFGELDDFHPDQIVGKLSSLQSLRSLRPQLLNASTSAKAAKQLQTFLSTPLPKPPRRPSARPGESDGETLARLLGQAAPSAPSPTSTAQTAAAALIKQAVSGSIIQNPTAHQKELVGALDAASAEQLRAVLNHPQFQALESAWRSVDLLVQSFDEGDQVKLLLVDLSKDEIIADQNACDDVTGSGLYRLLYDATTEAPWTVAATLYTFGDTPEDLALAGRMALAGAYLSTPILGAASPFLVGCSDFATQPDPSSWANLDGTSLGAAYTELRQKPESAFLGLALPRFLLRQPYGKTSDPIDAFPFEEVSDGALHESYLWGNPSVVIVHLLIERFKAEGWSLTPEAGGEMGGLPVHHYKQGGESLTKPCAEAWLGERAVVALQGQGLIPVLSVKNRDSVRVGRINAISEPTQALALRLT